MTDQGSLNIRWADRLIAGLAAAGVRQAVISPGSRSTPLVLACDRHPDIEITLVVDERCAAFFALGLSRATATPALVIATSGSAPAHWYPAVIEAKQAAVPLVLLSADRPPELHYSGANQTIEQQKLFGQQVLAFYESGLPQDDTEALLATELLGIKAAHRAQGPRPGPVHINQPFREPLVPPELPPWQKGRGAVPVPAQSVATDGSQLERIGERISGQPGLIVCGPGNLEKRQIDSLMALARRLQVPVLADPLSNLRFGEHDRSLLISRYDTFLRNAHFTSAAAPAWLIRVGAMPVSKALQQYLQQHAPETLLLAPAEAWPDPLHLTTERVYSDVEYFCRKLCDLSPRQAPDEWLDTFIARERAVDQLIDDGSLNLPLEGRVVTEILDRLPPGAILFSGNSLPIRQLDCWSGSAEKPLRIVANRGASGIDGNISTLLGLARGADVPVVGLVGDLTFYHDMNGLLNSQGADAVIILFNNGGGAIFDYLPQAGLECFESYWLTPHQLLFEHAARLYSLNYQKIDQFADFSLTFQRALDEPGLSLIEVTIDREASLRMHRAFWRRASQPEV